MKKHKNFYRRWTGVAAACAIVAMASAGALAAAAYFQKESHQESDNLTYEFDINYDLIPGEYKVTAGYLPEGYTEHGDGKFNAGDNKNISIMPIYTMAELDKLDGELVLSGIENVEHTTLSGMEADMITYKYGQTYIFLFNGAEGYVLQIFADNQVDREELKKFADHLTIERVGDTHYETEEEKVKRVEEEASVKERTQTAESTWKELRAAGIPEEKIVGIGEELKTMDGCFGYTVTGYEYLDSIEGFDEDKFFDFSRFDGWLNPDKTLKPYTRQHGERFFGQPLEEEGTNSYYSSIPNENFYCIHPALIIVFIKLKA